MTMARRMQREHLRRDVVAWGEKKEEREKGIVEVRCGPRLALPVWGKKGRNDHTSMPTYSPSPVSHSGSSELSCIWQDAGYVMLLDATS